MEYFETIKCYDYKVFNLEYHIKRIARTIGLNINLSEYIYPPNAELLRCKVIYNESGILSVNFFPYKKRNIKKLKLLNADNLDYSKKYLNRDTLDELFLQKDKADDIIIIQDGLITDTSIANIAIYYENRWISPKKPLLYGTTRARLIEANELFELDITKQMLYKASKIALLNAMIGFDEIDDYCIVE